MSKPGYLAYYRTLLGCGDSTDIVETKDAYSWLDAKAGQFVGWSDSDGHRLISITHKVSFKSISSETEFKRYKRYIQLVLGLN